MWEVGFFQMFLLITTNNFNVMGGGGEDHQNLNDREGGEKTSAPAPQSFEMERPSANNCLYGDL